MKSLMGALWPISISLFFCLSHAVVLRRQPSSRLSLRVDNVSTNSQQGQAGFLRSKSNHSLDSCFDAVSWLSQFVPPHSNRIGYSQGNQDAVLASLFSAANLGTSQRYSVEFGFNTPSLELNSNVGILVERLGFTHLLLDGGWTNPALNLHQRMLSAANIDSVFQEFNVPQEPDYVSVDIDSCELWLFMEIAQKYRPRVISVEYNSNYALGNYTTQQCHGAEPWLSYMWNGDNIYGASLSALALAAKHRGYVPVYVTRVLDVFLVREDLLCSGTAPAIETFASDTSIPNGNAYQASPAAHNKLPASELLMDFNQWLMAHPHA